MAGLASINIRFVADLKQFSDQMQNASRDITRVGKDLQGLGAKMSLALTAPLAILGGKSFTVFADFEDGMAKVNAISGATSVEFAALKKNAEELGAATRFTSSEVAGLQLNYSKLGFKPDEILAATEATLNLALATGEDLAESATVAASTIKAFGLSADETVRVTDVMAKSFSSSALDLQKFSTAMSILAPVANTAGVSLEEATGLLSVLVNAGVDASTAGTGLRNIFLDLADSGMTLEQAFTKIQTSTNKNKTAMDLFGKRGATVATVLANNIDGARGLAKEYENAAGSTAEMAKIMDATSKGGLARMSSAIEGLASSLGERMAPLVNKVADIIGEIANRFNALSATTKTVILIVGGLVAAIGPLIAAVGTMLTIMPVLVAGFVAIKGAFLSFTAVLAANPVTAIAVALGLLVAGIYAYTSATKNAVDVAALYNEVTANAAKSLANEKAQLDTLLKVARDETLSKEQRQSAIDKLNKISPEYLGNLRLETINTNEAKKAIDQYNESLNQTALRQAVLAKKTELFNNLITVQNKDLSMTGNVFTESSQKASNYIFSLLGVETQVIKNRKELEQYIKASKLDAQQAGAVRSAYEPLIKARETEEKYIQDQIDALDKFNNVGSESIAVTAGLTEATTALSEARKRVPLAGTIEFYEAEISKLQKLQKETSRTRDAYFSLQDGINAFQSKIDAISKLETVKGSDIKPIKLPAIDASEFLKSQVAAKDLYLEQQKSRNDAAAALDEEFRLNAQAFNEGITEIMQSLGQSFAAGFGEMIGKSLEGGLSIQSVWTLMITSLADMAIQVGKLAIGIGISVGGIKKALTSLNPVVAIAAGVALVALGTLAKSALSSIAGGGNMPAFANGGVVPGTSLYGDKILARVNSGELIMNQKQQSNLWGMMSQSGGAGVNIALDGAFKLTGSDLELVIERAINKNSRKR